jgi:putative phosphoesterase
MRIGVISDTHDLLRPKAMAVLRGCDHILHGGDITQANVLEALEALAPVTAVRGNNDRGAWAARLRETELVELGAIRIYMIHDLARIDIDPPAAGVQVVVSGHSHRPSIRERGGVLFVNPGSAGPRRFKLPIALAELVVGDGNVSARLIDLETGAVGPACTS